jgi:hypothetical protein
MIRASAGIWSNGLTTRQPTNEEQNMASRRFSFTALIVVNIACWCVLGFYQSPSWAQKRRDPPFANSVDQRNEMVEQLKRLNAQLETQNSFLQSGQLKVVVVESKK